jgi:hypothetical protein
LQYFESPHLPKNSSKLAFIFFDRESVPIIDDLKKGHNITGEYHNTKLHQLKETIKEKCQGRLHLQVLLLQDNAPVHKIQIVVDEAASCRFELLPHALYSPDLACSDFPISKTEMVTISEVMIMLSMPLKHTSRHKIHPSSRKGLECMNIVTLCVLKSRGTMLRIHCNA